MDHKTTGEKSDRADDPEKRDFHRFAVFAWGKDEERVQPVGQGRAKRPRNRIVQHQVIGAQGFGNKFAVHRHAFSGRKKGQ